MGNGEQTIGQQLEQALDDINALIPNANDAQLKTLEAQRSQVLAESGRLLEMNLDKASVRYRSATAALQIASATVKDAIEGMENVATAIETLGEALQLVSQLKP
jgi:hypothetical protein